MFVFIYVAFLIGCKPSNKVSKITVEKAEEIIVVDSTNGVKKIIHGDTTVIGLAKEETKTGAFLKADDNRRYLIQNLNKWPKDISGKRVLVKGEWVTIDRRQSFERTPYPPQGIAFYELLKNAKWKIIE